MAEETASSMKVQHKAKDVNDLIATYNDFEVTTVMKNGHVVCLWQQNKRKLNPTFKIFENIVKTKAIDYNPLSLHASINNIINKIKKMHPKYYWTQIVQFLEEPFKFPTSKEKISPKVPPQVVIEALKSTADTTPTSSKELRRDCTKCASKRRSTNQLLNTNKRLKLAIQNYQSDIEKYKICEIKRLNQTIKRKNDQIRNRDFKIVQLKKTNKELKKNKMMEPLQSSIQFQMIKSKLKYVTSVRNKKSSKIMELNESIKLKNKEINNLKNEISTLKLSLEHLMCQMEELNNEKETISLKEGKTYNAKTRLCMYESLIRNVPVAAAGQLLQFYLEQEAGLKLDCVPQQSTVGQMSYELGILADLQIAETLASQENITLSWDATTLDGNHVNEVHISAPDKTLALDVRSIPGGKAVDYVDHISDKFKYLVDLHYKFSNCESDKDLFYKSMISSIKSTLTDRAPVNHCVVTHLNALFDRQLLELNCNVHILDGFATGARRALLVADSEIGNRTLSCIYGVSKLRYSQGSGDPSGFKTFFKSRNIPIGIFVRYVGNRLNVLFHSAGIIVLHLEMLKDFVRVGTLSLKKHLRSDLDDPRILAQLIALGLIGKVITGPWMTKFYSSTKNLDMCSVIQSCKPALDSFARQPEELLNPLAIVNVFSESLSTDSDQVLAALLKIGEAHRGKVIDTLKHVLKEVVQVFDRQLARFFSGDLSNPTPQQMNQASSAPSHNMASERILGMTDYFWRRAPNSTFDYISGKIRGRTNDTVTWVLGHKEQDRLVSFAVKEGYRAREEATRRKRILEDVKMRRQLELQQQQEQSQRKELESKVKIALAAKTLNAEVFSSASSEVKVFIEKFLTSDDPTSELSEAYLGQLVRHVWTDKGVDTVYNGKVVGFFEEEGVVSCTISYWRLDELETDSDDYDMTMTATVTDLLLGDLSFVD